MSLFGTEGKTLNKELEEVLGKDNDRLLEEYSTFPTLKIFKKGGKSKYIYLLKNDIVKKRYSYKNKDHLSHFVNEVKILTKLSDCDFVPKILALDTKKLIIYMNYCGNSFDLLDPIQFKNKFPEINKKIHLLEEKWGVVRYRKITKLNSNDSNLINPIIDARNICFKDNKIYIIDFGSPLWKIKKPKNK